MVFSDDPVCFRLTRSTLEIRLGGRATSRSRVVVIRGSNLFLLWNELLGYKVSLLEPGMFGIASISEAKDWTHASLPMFPDPNPAREDCLLIETTTARDLWSRRSLEYFGVSAKKRMLYQFGGRNAYILIPKEERYEALRNAMLATNFQPGTPNTFTAHGTVEYPPGSTSTPFRFDDIKYAQNDVVGEGHWHAIFDNRSRRASHGIAMSP